MFSVFFSHANLAAACAAIFYFIGYLPYALVIQWEEYMQNWHKALAVSRLSYKIYTGWPIKMSPTFMPKKRKVGRNLSGKNKLCNYRLFSLNRQTCGTIVVSAVLKPTTT